MLGRNCQQEVTSLRVVVFGGAQTLPEGGKAANVIMRAQRGMLKKTLRPICRHNQMVSRVREREESFIAVDASVKKGPAVKKVYILLNGRT